MSPLFLPSDGKACAPDLRLLLSAEEVLDGFGGGLAEVAGSLGLVGLGGFGGSEDGTADVGRLVENPRHLADGFLGQDVTALFGDSGGYGQEDLADQDGGVDLLVAAASCVRSISERRRPVETQGLASPPPVAVARHRSVLLPASSVRPFRLLRG